MGFVAFSPQKFLLLALHTSPLFSRLNLNLFYYFFLQGAVGPLGPTGDRGNKGREVKKIVHKLRTNITSSMAGTVTMTRKKKMNEQGTPFHPNKKFELYSFDNRSTSDLSSSLSSFS